LIVWIWLDDHLYNSLNKTIPVSEVARGQSKYPLYVTALGISLEEAAENIKLMSGKYKMPDLLNYLDQQTKLFKFED